MMSEIEPGSRALTEAPQKEATPKGLRISWPQWYWPWWVLLSLAVVALMAASYFAGMLTTVSHAHTLLSSLHQQLQQVAQEKAQLHKQAEALGVLHEWQTGHWNSPLIWSVFVPQWAWYLSGIVTGSFLVTGLRYKRNRRHVPSHMSMPEESRDSVIPSRRPASHHHWTHELVGLVLWVGIIAALGFFIVHGRDTLGVSFPSLHL
ncbi:hypothetical protein [Sulfobacillus sp. hq2]|uniref:hypothetical protein n=1 Tax=Sulfobacillus TaxID=28033 RepID=UPI0011AF84B9|nr:hypothetical protein [Sulfobacillus sp. hq2]